VKVVAALEPERCMRDVRLAWLATHPIQYQAPLLRALARTPGLDLTAIFFSDFSTHSYVDREFGRTVEWDVPLLDGYRHVFLPGTGNRETGIAFLRPRISGLKQLMTRQHFDAVLVQGWIHYGYVMAAWLAHHGGVKVLLRCEATDHVTSSTGIKRVAREMLVRFLLAQVDQFVAIGTRNRSFYLSRGIAPDRIGQMPYCVDNNYFQAQARAADKIRLRTELGLDGRPVILFASKLIARKHGDDLLRAYGHLDGPKPYLLFVGDGEQRAELMRIAQDNCFSAVRFLGFRNQSELPAFYALADIFVLPSVDETWGLVVNEAMNAGCAIVVSDQVGSGADLVKDGENGFVFAARDVTALANALSATLADDQYRAMGQRSLDIVAGWGIEANVAGLSAALGIREPPHEIQHCRADLQ